MTNPSDENKGVKPLPCPFCGGNPVVRDGFSRIACWDPQCAGGNWPTSSKKWNKRPLEESLRAALEEERKGWKRSVDYANQRFEAARDALIFEMEEQAKGILRVGGPTPLSVKADKEIEKRLKERRK